MTLNLRTFWRWLLTSVTSLIAFLLLWHLAVTFFDIKPYVLPSPFRVLRLGVERGFLVEHIVVSTTRVMIGFLLAVVVAVPIGLVMGISRWTRTVVSPVLSLIRPLPSMSWIPLSIIWFGLDEQQKYYIVFMGSLAPLLVYTMEATMQVDSTLRLAARNLGASRLQEVFLVVLPAALPTIIGGMKVVLAIAWTCVISAEMIGTNSGLGYIILHGKDVGATELVFLGMLCISLTVLVLDALFRGLEWTLLPYRRGRE